MSGNESGACKFCRRERTHPNPNRKQAEQDPTKKFLQWARQEGRECAPCRAHIKSQFPDFNDRKGALAKKIKDSEDFRDKYDQSLRRWEEALYVQGQRSRPSMSSGGRSVEAAKVSMLQTTQCIGHLWPQRIYESHFGKAAPKQLTVVSHCGQQIRGVVLDPAQGWQPGVVKLDTVGQSMVKNTQVMEVDDELREGGIDEVYDNAAKTIGGIMVKKRKKGDGDDDKAPDTFAVGGASKKPKKNDNDDDSSEDVLGNVLNLGGLKTVGFKKKADSKGTKDEKESDNDDGGSAKVARTKATATATAVANDEVMCVSDADGSASAHSSGGG